MYPLAHSPAAHTPATHSPHTPAPMSLTYYTTISTRAKGRWYGRTIREIRAELGAGAQMCDDPDKVVARTDTVSYRLHVHEPPVPPLARGAVLADGPDHLVVNKPSGIPVHPTVNYHVHSVTEQLRAAHGRLFPCYRLDRLTSGVLVLGKSAAFAARFRAEPRHAKVYVARVRARDVPPAFERAVVEHPVFTHNNKRGYAQFLADAGRAKAARTTVELLRRGTDFALLRCTLHTGRTHQIRKHLALEGMPIHNDAIYRSGAYRRLYLDPSESNFRALCDEAEQRRLAKVRGECGECGAPLYADDIDALDLHCQTYEFGSSRYVCAAPFDV